MKQILILGFLLYLAVSAAGQVQNVDSLVNVLKTQDLKPDEQMALYSTIGHEYLYREPEKAIEYAKKGLTLALKAKDKVRAAKFYDDLGCASHLQAKYDSAFVFFNKSLELAIEAKDEEQEACVYINLGVLKRSQGDLAAALEYYMRALPIYEQTGNKINRAIILRNMGSIHRTLKNPERALYYVKQAEEMNETIDDIYIKMGNGFELGAIYLDLEEPEKGMEYLQKVYELALETGHKSYEAVSLQAMGEHYREYKDYDKAIECANKCLQIGKITGDPRLIAGSCNTLSRIYASQGNLKECNATASEAWEIDSLDLHNTPGTLFNLILSDIHLGNKNRAAGFLTTLYEMLTKKNDDNFHKILMDMEVKYETEKKEMRIASLEKERELYIWLGIACVLLVLALAAILWQTKRNARKEKQLIATRSVLDGEMRERARLAQDLHDRLSGNLSAVKIELVGHADTLQNVRDKLDNCIRDIREAAHGLMPTSLQSGLKVALGDFAAQFPNVKFHFFGQEKRIDERVEFVVYCCANELVNNAVKHSGATTINLQLVQDEKYVTLTVSDDGSGYNEKAVTKGMGLKNIRDRVASCNGKIDISTSPGNGTETTIELKANKKS